ncbi:MAG: TlpA disulfide reductase family protein [Candidatus Acidiferrales bacterium]
MKRSGIAISAAALALALILAVIAGTRAARPLVRRSLAAAKPNPPKAARKNKDPGGSNDGGPLVLHFARNPEAAPAFLVADLNGNIISTAALKGKVVLINFWATWCPPCREEIPELIELQSEYKDQLQIVGVSLDDLPPEQVKEFALREGINYPIIMASREILQEYGGAPALPTNFVVNTEGRVVQKHVGLFSIEIYEREIRSLAGLPVDAKIETFDDTGQIFLKNAANASELPGVDFSKLSPEQKKAALKRMNAESCNCGCKLTIAQCRINDTACGVSKDLAARIVKEVASAAPPKPDSARPSPSEK